MTLGELIRWTGQYPAALGGGLGVPPALALLVGLAHARGNGGRAPWKYLYSFLVYAACVPGTCAAVLTAYAIFFRNDNLLDVNLLVYIVPIVSMTVTLILIRKNVRFDEVPGFDRLSGLIVMIAVSFGIVLAIHKTRIVFAFFGSIQWVITFGVFVFLLLKWATHRAFRDRDDPKLDPPSFPGLS